MELEEIDPILDSSGHFLFLYICIYFSVILSGCVVLLIILLNILRDMNTRFVPQMRTWGT